MSCFIIVQEALRKRRQSEGHDLAFFDYPPATFFRFDPLPLEDSNQEVYSEDEEEVMEYMHARMYSCI